MGKQLRNKRILRELDSNHLKVVSQRGKRHLVLKVANTSGNTALISLASTPSDHRAERNAIAQIRRTARNLA